MGLAADFVLIVVAGLLGGIVARLLRLPLLVGYVVAGVFVGPNTSGPTIAQIEDIETLAEIGVALLLFSIGLEVSFRDLGAVRKVAVFGGAMQIAITCAAASIASAHFMGFTHTESLWFGAMTSVSSTMVVLKVLAAGGVQSTLASRVMIGLLLVQDLAVIPMLIILPQLGAPQPDGGSGSLLVPITTAVAAAAALIAAVFFTGTRLLPPLLRGIVSWGSRELFLVAVVATGVGLGAAMHAAGISFALGAFIAGLILSESEFSHQALSDVVPLRDIIGLMFFVSVGMLFDPSYALDHLGLIAVIVLVILLGKALIAGLIARGFGYRYMAPWLIGLGLSQIGEFSFVLARTGLNGGFVSKPVYDLALTSTVVTMGLSPLVFAAALPLGRAWRRRFPPEAAARPEPLPETTLHDHIVVAGYGRTGQAVARALREAGVPSLVVESNFSITADVRDDGLWGDISRDEILHAAGVERARMLLLTMPERDTVSLAISRSRVLNPNLPVVARSTSAPFTRQLRELGVLAVQPEFEGGIEIVRQGLQRCGRAEPEVARIVDQLRSEMYREADGKS